MILVQNTGKIKTHITNYISHKTLTELNFSTMQPSFQNFITVECEHKLKILFHFLTTIWGSQEFPRYETWNEGFSLIYFHRSARKQRRPFRSNTNSTWLAVENQAQFLSHLWLCFRPYRFAVGGGSISDDFHFGKCSNIKKSSPGFYTQYVWSMIVDGVPTINEHSTGSHHAVCWHKVKTFSNSTGIHSTFGRYI